MHPSGLLWLLMSVAWACPQGFQKVAVDECSTQIKSTSWEEGLYECVRRGGPYASFASSKVDLMKQRKIVPLWALPKELRMETESEDECHVKLICSEAKDVNVTDIDNCEVRDLYSDCRRLRKDNLKESCMLYKSNVTVPSLEIFSKSDHLYIRINNRYLLNDLRCILVEFNQSEHGFKMASRIRITERAKQRRRYIKRITFTTSVNSFEQLALWCLGLDKRTGLMVKSDVYSAGLCPTGSSLCYEAILGKSGANKKLWCKHTAQCSTPLTTTTTTTTRSTVAPPGDSRSDVIGAVDKLDEAIKGITTASSNLSDTLRDFGEILKSFTPQKGTNISIERDEISVLVLPEAFGVISTESGLTEVPSYSTASHLANIEDVKSAVVLPNSGKVAFVVYKNDSIFQDAVFQVNSPVVEVIADNVSYVDIVLRPLRRESNRVCAFWDLQTRKWNTSGCSLHLRGEVNDVCRCTHLTTFAQIVFDAGLLTPEDQMALEYISVVGCAASLLGALGTVVVSALCPEWRRRKSTLMLLNLTAAVALRDALFLAAAHGGSACVCVGVALHYAELAAGAWCVVAGVLQIFRFTTLTRGSVGVSHLVLRCVLVAWPAAALPVATLLGVQGPQAYAPGDSFAPGLCFPRGAALLWAATLPLGLATLTNAGVFLFLAWLLCGCSQDSRLRAARHGGPGLRTKALKCVMLCFLLGLPWLFGVPADCRVLPYVFCLTATPQGLVLFLFFVVSNKHLRSRCFLALRRRSQKQDSIFTTVETTYAVKAE